MTLGELRVRLGVDAHPLKEGEKAIAQFAQHAERDIRKLEMSLKQRGEALSKFGKQMSLAITAPLVALAALGIKQAVEAESVGRKFGAAFGASADRVLVTLERLKKTIPEGTTELQDMAATLQDLQRNMGVSAIRAEGMSVELIKIADAVGKVKGRQTSDVLEAFRSGIAGNTRGLKEFGIVIDESNIKQEAFRLGILKQGQELTNAGQALAVFSLIQKQTANTQAAAATMTDSASRKLQRMKVELTEMAEELGRRLLPSFLAFGRMVTNIAGAFAKMDPNLQNAVIAFAAIAATVGPLLFLLGSLMKTVVAVTVAVRALSAAMVGLSFTPAGAILVGLGLLAGAFLLIKGNMDTATAASNTFRDSLKTLTAAELRLTQAVLLGESANAYAAEAKALKEIVSLKSKSALSDRQSIQLLDAEESLKKAREQMSKYKDMSAAATAQLKRLAGEAKRLEGAGGTFSIDTTPLSAIEKAAADADNLITAFETIGIKSLQTRGYWTEIEALQQRVRAILAAQVNQYGETANQARVVLAALQEVANQKPPPFITIMGQNLQGVIDKFKGLIGVVAGAPAAQLTRPLDVRILSLEQAAARFQTLQDSLDLAIVSGAGGAVDRIKKDMDELRALARQTGAALARALDAPGISPADRARGLELLRTTFAGLGIPIGAAATESSKLEEQLKALQETGELALSQLTAGFGGLSQSIRTTFGSVLTLLAGLQSAGNALKKLAAERKAAEANGKSTLGSLASLLQLGGAAAQIAGSVIQLGQAIFGQSQRQREVVEALRSNAETIQRATAELSGSLRGARNIQNAQRAAAAIAAAVAASRPGGKSDGHGGKGPSLTERLNTQLQKFGLTLAQLNLIASDNGITLLDSKGHIIAAAFDQLNTVLGLAIVSLTKWGRDLDSQRERQSLHDLVNNVISSPINTLGNELQLLTKQAPKLGAMFAGLDATSREGREQFRNALRNLLALIDSGTIGGLLGGLEDIGQLNTIITGLAGALNEMDSATRSLTESLTNVPTGFRVAAARFNASAPAPSGNMLPAVGSSAVNVTFAAGSIVQQPGENGESLAQRVVAELQQKARRQTGSPVNWGSVS